MKRTPYEDRYGPQPRFDRFEGEWMPNPHNPVELRADIEIEGSSCVLKLLDHVAPSTIHYRSVEVLAPYQGRGRSLHLEVNGVALNLEWSGGNSPPFPAPPVRANYRRDGLSAEQVSQLRGS